MSVAYLKVALSGLTTGLVGLLAAAPALALPGQTVEEVLSWMQSNPTVRPKSGERLTVRRSNSAAQRFIFEASLFIPGTFAKGARDDGRIHSESLKLFDMQNGVTQARLEESLRAIYGLEVGGDFDRATVVQRYGADPTIPSTTTRTTSRTTSSTTTKTPKWTPKLVNKPRRQDYLRGEVRQGERFAYWIEVAQTEEGKAYSGQVAIFLVDDLESVLAKVRSD
jgi:hypothetical protein